MKNLLLLLVAFLISLNLFGQKIKDEQKRDFVFYNVTSKWFSAWQLVSKEIYQVTHVRPVEFIFFDDKYVYSTSRITVKNGKFVKGCNLMNLSFKWKKALHKDTIILPDKSIVPIKLMSFAGVIPNEKNKSYFVMPLPSYWKSSGITSKELGLANLITGVFIHEFSHSQQMQNFGEKISQFGQQNNFGVEVTDDIVQNIFAKNLSYLKIYHQEVQKLYQSVKNKTIDNSLVKDGLQLMKQRQHEYFKGQYLSLRQIDSFFLTMEGLGQYSMYLWLTNPKGGNLKKSIAIDGVRRKKKQWSQDEGFALFLILDRLSKPQTWAKEMFGDKTENVVNLISKQFR
ncbi:MAG: hypothetical protein ABI091_15360 [Ferruginibacter sp.]